MLIRVASHRRQFGFVKKTAANESVKQEKKT
jgi:hypothetical protein